MSKSTVRALTQAHAQHIYNRRRSERIEKRPTGTGRNCVIAETDGSLVPIIVPDKNAEDRRKGKGHFWKEARLSIAHIPGETTLKFGVEFQENVDEAGKDIFDCACRAGFGSGTYLHAAGDGAPWIAGQVNKQFGSRGNYLVDFYHVCEYPAGAASTCSSADEKKIWVEQQKELLKRGQAEEVIEALTPHPEPKKTKDKNAPVRRCLRYLSNRPSRFDYPEAQKRGLPIGSGEIESAHRYVIQERLKIAGAWRTIENARIMLSLRVDRADGYWIEYWNNLAKAV